MSAGDAQVDAAVRVVVHSPVYCCLVSTATHNDDNVVGLLLVY